MSLTEEDQLLESLCWSSVEHPLDKFLEDYTLPQLVCISGGHYGENQTTTLGSGQVLTLHALSSRKTLVGDDSNGKPLTVSLDCPVKVYVYPLERDKYPGVQAAAKTVDVFSGARYVRALEGYLDRETEDEVFEANDILEIMEIDKKNSIVRCWNMATKNQVSFPFQCTTSLLALLDYQEYTLAEVKEKFDLPVKVSFISAGDELSQSLSSFGIILLLGETDETVVIATTVGGTAEDKLYHILQKDLDICVCVAEEILSGDETYEQITTKLHDDVRVQKLFDFDQVAVCRARSAIRRFVRPTRHDFLDHEPSTEVLRKHADMRLRLTRPPIAPKPNKNHHSRDSSLGQPSSPHHIPPDFYDLDNDDTYEEVPDDVSINPVGHRRDPPSSPGHPPALPPRNYQSDREANVALDKSKSDVGFEKTLSSSSRLPSKPSESRQPRNYHSTSEIRSESTEDQSRRVHNLQTELYDTIYPTTIFPNDLSSLTVEEVGKVLKGLNMGCYVTTFREEMINGEMLVSLDEECLLSLKMNIFHCRKMISFINGWRP